MIAVEEFRADVRQWLADNLVGDYAALRGLGGPGREHEAFDERLAWNRHLAAAGLTCLGWPVEHGGRGLSVAHRVAFYEEYAKAEAPDKVNHLGEELLGPTLIAYGTAEQQRRFLPAIRDVTELWSQGYSEPGAGSDLANVSTSAVLDGKYWVINGQKVWTSLAHWAQWCFVVARTEKGSKRHAGLSYLLVPLDQPGVEVRPIVQLTGDSEFNEVFFAGGALTRFGDADRARDAERAQVCPRIHAARQHLLFRHFERGRPSMGGQRTGERLCGAGICRVAPQLSLRRRR